MSDWSDWHLFPDPRNKEYLHAPFGPGVYELRHKTTGESILFGRGRNVAYRMTSLLPQPLGQGTRRNEDKRLYVLEHIDDIEYRTLACETEEEAKREEAWLKMAGRYRFPM